MRASFWRDIDRTGVLHFVDVSPYLLSYWNISGRKSRTFELLLVFCFIRVLRSFLPAGLSYC